ncbi:hypothetical protein SAMN04487765_0480 [Tenacibaculum sp. MAR_2010_89]|jgi:hypothetical protein|uniref:hypothetical protein n=1 Tax=Tenacibaculum sp. MAR_2010_89 TaxID=1250198 RepID=UPI00089B9888|nr:hypothetical protein [Tenacibaculum sp. MAR_2010_89]SED60517.1 hypothetical protein SAMN04487765_0480 [Tenacibaculum sp. MAR_2010_89]
MSEILGLLLVGYLVVTGASLIIVIIKLLIPQHIFTIDEVAEYKSEVYNCVLELIQEDLGVQIKGLTVIYDYSPNDEFKGFYQQENHSITLFLENLDNVHSFILTLLEEIHHSIFVSTKSGIKIYELYDKKVGYDNNPLEYAAKVYARDKFKSIHRVLKKKGLIRYKV